LPITNAFAVTINKTKENAFKNVGIYLFFVACVSHDQFCAASSKASSLEKVVISIMEGPRQLVENWRQMK
jgi:hypothetical protein